MLKIAWTPLYAHPLPQGHRFPMAKYDKLPELLLTEGTISPGNLFAPKPIERDVLLMTHQAAYLDKLDSLLLTKHEERRTGFPLSAQLVEREKVILQGTIDCCEFALQHGVAMNIAGGTHHAYAEHGEGFCLLNDLAVSSNWLLHTGQVKRILVVDLDVHQGNGTAALLTDHNKVFTLSFHGANNYPMHKERSALDVPLPDGTNDGDYLAKLETILPKLIDDFKPDFVHFQSGVDVLATDKLGRLSLTAEGCLQRDAFVLQTLKSRCIPVVCTMGGGYSEDLAQIVDAHANTFRLAQEVFF
jgi:acetoin utilization deacetylase AcuC-like enzyme